MNDGPTRAEWQRLYETTDRGFAGINSRLDLLNGRIGKGEVSDAELRTRIVSLEHEVFRERRHGGDRRGEMNADDVVAPVVSRKEGAIAMISLAGLVTALEIIKFLLTKAWVFIAGAKG